MFELRTIERVAQMIEKEKSSAEVAGTKPDYAPKPVGPVDWVTPRATTASSRASQLVPLYLIQPFYNMMRWVFFDVLVAHVPLPRSEFALHAITYFMSTSQNFGMHAMHRTFTALCSSCPFSSPFSRGDSRVAHLSAERHHLQMARARRLQAGSYPLWGQYYLRWFLVEQVTKIAGLGIFELSTLSHGTCVMASPSRGTSFVNPKAIIGDFDLITIEKNSTIDEGCTLCLRLTRRHATVPVYIGGVHAAHAVCGPGAHVPSGSTVAAFTSWREVDQLVKPTSAKTAQMHSETPSIASACSRLAHCVFLLFVGCLDSRVARRAATTGDNLLTHAGTRLRRELKRWIVNTTREVFVTLLDV